MSSVCFSDYNQKLFKTIRFTLADFSDLFSLLINFPVYIQCCTMILVVFFIYIFFLLKRMSCFFLSIDKACFTQFENVGCYADKQLSPKPIPDLLFSDLDKESPKYSGNEARLGELDTYLSDVLCRCAEQAQELGYTFFGVQNHGQSRLTQVKSSFQSYTNMANYCEDKCYNLS